MDYLRSLITYDPDTGVFIWKRRIFTSARAECWNTTFAGTVAGREATNGYWDISVDYTRYRAHRLAWLYVTGEWPSDKIDHINGNKKDNRFINLRPATSYQNSCNSKGRSHNLTGLKGVGVWHYRGIKYFRARITVNKKVFNLGYFKTPEEAYAAYCAASEKYHKDFGNIS